MRKFLLLLVPLSLRILAGAQELPFTHYTPEKEVNPLPSSAIMMSYQDRPGYIWFVVYSSGLVRYDGRSMELYTTEDGLPAVDVRDLFEDKDGRLWVTTEAGLAVSSRSLDRFEPGERLSFVTTIGGKPLLSVSVIENRAVPAPDGKVWVGTRNYGIIRYDPINDSTLAVDTVQTNLLGPENLEVRSLAMSHDGRIWASLGRGMIALFDSAGACIGHSDHTKGLPDEEADALSESRSGTLYAGFVNGEVWTLKGDVRHPQLRKVNAPLTSRITDITISPEGIVWVSSEQSGVFRFSEGSAEGDHYTIRNGLLSDLVRNVQIDREGNIWISQIGGISKLHSDYDAFLSYTADSPGGLPPYLLNEGVNNVLPEKKGSPFHGIWVATSGGGATFIGRNGESAQVGMQQGLRSDWVHALALDGEGRLWIGTSAGLSCLALKSGASAPKGRGEHQLRLPQGPAVLTSYGVSNPTIYSCEVLPLRGDGPGHSAESVWFTAYGAVYCFVSGTWYIFGTDAGLPGTYFTSLAEDSSGRLWIGTRDQGLFRSVEPVTNGVLAKAHTRLFQQDRSGNSFGREVRDSLFVRVWSEENGAPSNQIESLVFQGGILWVGSPEGLTGLEATRAEAVARIAVDNGLPGPDVTSLAFSPLTGTLWLGTNGGLAEVDPAEKKVLRSLTKQDGLLDNEVWWYGSVRVGTDGKVFFGTAKGLAEFDPSKERRNEVLPIVRFRSIQQHEDLSSNSLVVRYAALSFADEHQVRFKTMLEGFEDEWSEETTDVTMRYTNLPAFFVGRTYTARVLASNNDGVWTEAPLEYSFVVQPPWWFRWWFSAFNLLLLAGLSYTFLHYRTLQLKRRSKELERIVDERTVEIREKADQISQQKDELALKNVELEEKNAEIIRTQEQLIVQEKLASLGALTAGIAHEIKNPLNFVNNFSELSVEIAQELKEDLETVRGKLDEETFKRLEYSCLDLGENAQKIHEHGKRADGIVKGMLEHSRGQTGEREAVNINTLLDEYGTLAYHGLKAQEPDCTIRFEKQYDETMAPLDVFPQDLSRVFLNIVNNACYAVYEKQKQQGKLFTPVISVATKGTDSGVVITIRDNGTGMPRDVVEKIFNPFFTTKPTGKGTGLGLSLSHDIIVKQHGGKIEVDTESGEFSEFRVFLPRRDQKRGTE